MRSYLLVIFLMVCSTAIAQQTNPLPVVHQKMEALKWLSGKWQGTAHIKGADGNKQEYNHVLEFSNNLNNTVMLLNESLARGKDTVVFNIGLLGYDVLQSKYNLQAYTSDGSHIDAYTEVLDKKIIWRIHLNGYVVKYTAKLNENGQWYQIGEMTANEGAMWNTFFESTLTQMK